MVYKLRLLTQHIMFLVIIYGGRVGIHLTHSLPCFSCPYVKGCGGSCYLMTLQGSWRGLQMSLAHMASDVGLEALWFLVLFVVWAAVLNKFWCGWICPFGTIQDWFTLLRKKLGIRESRLSWMARDRLKPIKRTFRISN